MADYTTKEIHVVFRGTQEFVRDLSEGILLKSELMGAQEAYVSTVYADVIQLMNELNNEDPGWTNPIQVTGHSLGGHLARTFSQISTAMEVPVECVVFNAAIPTVWERGTADDLMIYSDPSMWGWQGEVVHVDGLADSSIYPVVSRIMLGSEDHGIHSIIEALEGDGSLVSGQAYAAHCADPSAVLTISSFTIISASSHYLSAGRAGLAGP